MTIGDEKNNLSAMLHGGTLNKVRNIEMMFERAANTMLAKLDPIDTMRTAGLSQLVHDDEFNYSLPSDFKKAIDLYPQDSRNTKDTASRRGAESFDLRKSINNKTLSIEGSEGTKIMRINWRSRMGKVLHTMDSVTANGTWGAVGTTANIVADTIYKMSGAASIRFDVLASGDGISNTTMTAVDMTNEDEIADIYIPFYFESVANLTSIAIRWGNDVSANYWESTAQTAQADGTAFRAGWNTLKFSWVSATETGTVSPATTDSLRAVFTTTGAIQNVRMDNILFSIGRPFDMKYYSKYLLKNTAGTWISRTTSDDDIIVLDNDAIQIYHLENLIAAAQQLEGTDSAFDITWAKRELNGDPSSVDPVQRMGLYQKYRKEHPSMSKKLVGAYGSSPSRGRW